MKKIMLAAIVLLQLWVLLTSTIAAPDRPQPGKQAIENLTAFTKLYGYVKYFYPGDEAAQIDWNRFAVYGAQKIAPVNKAQLKQILEELFLPIAPALRIYKTGENAVFSIESITPPDTGGMKVVAWQHIGEGVGNAINGFKSIRLNRPEITSNWKKSAVLLQCQNAETLRGKEFKFSAAVKVKNGSGQLWFRVDRPNGKKGFFYNMYDRPIKSAKWSTHEITGQVDRDATKISFGGIFNGKGQLWIDNFQLLVKEDGKWKPTDLVSNSSFEDGQPGQAPEKWRKLREGYTSRNTTDTSTEGKQSIVISSDIKSLGVADPLFDKKPMFGEYIAKDLGSGLSILMPIALYGTPTATYPPAPEETLDRLTTALNSQLPGELSADNRYVRLADIVIAWNELQHFYPYFDQVKTDWASALTKALSSAYKDRTAADFHLTLKVLVAALKTGAGSVYFLKDKSVPHFLPIDWDRIENRLIITAVWDMNRSDIHPGDIVLEVDGVNAMAALEKKARVISAATDGWKYYQALNELLAGPMNSQTTLKLKHNGKQRKITLGRSLERRQFFRWRRQRQVSFKEIEPGIYYLNLDLIPMTDIEKLLPELAKARSIICDLRGFPNQNDKLLCHLLTEKKNTKWMYMPRIIYPDYEKVTYKEIGWSHGPVEPHLSAKIVFITRGSAIGYSESILGYIKGYKLATIVGQPTAGTNGNVNHFTLPGGYRVIYNGMKVLKHDGSTLHGVGFLPDVTVKRTIKGVKEGRDEFLEKAIQIAKE